jgi:cytochrome c oxidase subunit II
MLLTLPLFPEEASAVASRVDHLFIFLVSVSAIVSALIFLCIIYFAVKYRKGSKANRETSDKHTLPIEIAWTVIPFGVFLFMFAWGVRIYYDEHNPPPNAVRIYVVGKQWMWKIQHPEGKREIDELHIPVGSPVLLTMTSEDVIHDFFVPAFRVKQDVLPGRYTSLWFRPTRVGEYHFFCSQYCGTNHAAMIGHVFVMEPSDYQSWLSSGTPAESMASAGEKLFQRFHCDSCHKPGGRGPDLAGLLGKRVELQGGRSIVADEAYVRESILNPASRITAGYQATMPTYQGQFNETEILQLIAYIRSLGPARPTRGQP